MEKRVTISWCGFQIGDAMRVGKSGEKSKKTERRLRVVYQYRRGLRNVIAGIKSVISNCSNGCPSGWKDGTLEMAGARSLDGRACVRDGISCDRCAALGIGTRTVVVGVVDSERVDTV